MNQRSRILLTGFGPFRHYTSNPSELMVNDFNGLETKRFHLEGQVLPVSYELCRILPEKIAAEQPDAVVMLGLRATHRRIGIERIAINVAESRFPDETGDLLRNRKIDSAGPDGIFSTLPIQDIHSALLSAGFSAHISNSAGTYVCNALFYHVMCMASELKIPAGFIHLPALKHGWNESRLQSAVRIILDIVAGAIPMQDQDTQ